MGGGCERKAFASGLFVDVEIDGKKLGALGLACFKKAADVSM